MPRPTRYNNLYSIHHVMMRGNHKANILFNDDDYRYFCYRLKCAVNKYSCRIHLFCLMTNHIHLVIETSYIPLGNIIQSVSAPYSSFLHHYFGVKGRLFDDRYKAKPVRDERYLLELCDYVHYNPLQAQLVSHIDQYRWSSHPTYAEIEKIPWITTSLVNKILPKFVHTDVPYKSFTYERNQHYERVYTTHDRDGFLCDNNDSIIVDRTSYFDELILSQLTIDHISEIICNELNVSPIRMRSSSRTSELLLARCLTVYFANIFGGYTYM